MFLFLISIALWNQSHSLGMEVHINVDELNKNFSITIVLPSAQYQYVMDEWTDFP